MKIDAMSIIGFKEMFDVLQSNEKNQIYTVLTGGLGSKGNELMNDIHVTTMISDLSILEAIHMRDFSSTFQIISRELKFDISPDNNALQSHLFELEALLKAIETDTDIKDPNRLSPTILHILPICTQRFVAKVSFSGYGLQNILGMETRKLFIRENHWVYDEGHIKETISKMFAQKFFETLSRRMTTVDKETEFYLQQKHFTPMRSIYGSSQRIVQLNEVTSPVASFSFRSNTQAEIIDRCKLINKYMRDYKFNRMSIANKPDMAEGLVETINLNFTVVMNVSEFLMLKLILPQYIMNSENLSMQTRDRYIEIDPILREKYTARLEGPISNILVERENSEDIFTNFNYIMGGQVIVCNISIPYSALDFDASAYTSSFKRELPALNYCNARDDFRPFELEFDKALMMVMNIIKSVGE